MALDAAGRAADVTALAAYFEAVGRIAVEFVARGDVALAQGLLTQAARVAAVVSADRRSFTTSVVTGARECFVREGAAVADEVPRRPACLYCPHPCRATKGREACAACARRW